MADESPLITAARDALNASLQRAGAQAHADAATCAETLARTYANILETERRRIARDSKPAGLYSSAALDSSVAIKEIA